MTIFNDAADFLSGAAEEVAKPFQWAGEKIGLIAKPQVDIKGLGTTTVDPNVQTYSVSPDVAAAYAALAKPEVDPRMVTPGFSAADSVSSYSLAPTQVAAAVADKTATNQDAANQDAMRKAQLQQMAQLSAIAGGRVLTPADMDNLALLRQGQAFRTSVANTGRGGTDQRLALQRVAKSANVTAGGNNIATLAALRAGEQDTARGELASTLAGTQQQDQAFMGAAYNIANADATRGTQADVNNQTAATQAQIAQQSALVPAISADQQAAAAATAANDAAKVQAYRDATARQQAAQTGGAATAQLGLTAQRNAQTAQQGAQGVQLGYQQAGLEKEDAKANRKQKIASAAISTVGQTVAKTLAG
jgi:hypothetical protein